VTPLLFSWIEKSHKGLFFFFLSAPPPPKDSDLPVFPKKRFFSLSSRRKRCAGLIFGEEMVASFSSVLLGEELRALLFPLSEKSVSSPPFFLWRCKVTLKFKPFCLDLFSPPFGSPIRPPSLLLFTSYCAFSVSPLRLFSRGSKSGGPLPFLEVSETRTLFSFHGRSFLSAEKSMSILFPLSN